MTRSLVNLLHGRIEVKHVPNLLHNTELALHTEEHLYQQHGHDGSEREQRHPTLPGPCTSAAWTMRRFRNLLQVQNHLFQKDNRMWLHQLLDSHTTAQLYVFSYNHLKRIQKCYKTPLTKYTLL